MQTCTGPCNQSLPLNAFEVTKNKGCQPGLRKVCKKCRQAGRTQKAKEVPKKALHEYPLPARCIREDCEAPTVEEGAVFKFRDDTISGGYRNVCNACYNKSKYYETYRDREKEKDKAGFLKRSAEQHLDWARRNPDKVVAQQDLGRTVPARKFKALLQTAAAKGIEVDPRDEEALKAKMSHPCYYCAFAPQPGEALNGLDRIDSSLRKYDDEGTVPCCTTCNTMKAAYNVDDFLHGIRRIQAHIYGGDDAFLDAEAAGSSRRRLVAFGGTAGRRQADKKAKRMELTDEDKVVIWCKPCYLCGTAPALGIDREDANGNYSEGNCQPCCSQCNYMKKDLTLTEFKAHIGHIYAHTSLWVLRDAAELPLTLVTGKERQAVGVYDDDGIMLMAFPSIGNAATMIGIKDFAIVTAMNEGTRCRRHLWNRITASQYRDQQLPYEVAYARMLALRFKA